MKSILTFFLLIGFTAAIFSLPGCDKGETSVAGDRETKTEAKSESRTESESASSAKDNSRASDDSKAVAADSKNDPVGEWKIDPEETIKANSALMKRPGLDANAFKASINDMIMDFLFESDNTFACYEKANGQEANYSGTWELSGNRIGIYQKLRDDSEEEDELTGTIEGDRMELVHRKDGVSMNLVLTK